MTEFELEYLLTELGVAALETFGMYVTVTVAYLVAAYVAGEKLTKLQVFIVNTLFLVSTIISVWACIGYISRAIPIADALEVLNPDRRYSLQPPVLIAVLVVQSLGILACLKFMWDVRQPRT